MLTSKHFPMLSFHQNNASKFAVLCSLATACLHRVGRWSIGALAALSVPAFAAEIRWSATGSVSNVTTGFAASVGDPVSVKFSYDSGATAAVRSQFAFGASSYALTEFCNAISLSMEITIGQRIWSGKVPTSPPSGTLALLTDAWSGNGSPDKFTVLASSADAGVFAPFPYTGSNQDRSIQIILADATVPTGFLAPMVLPKADTQVSEITAASGFISAGEDRIDFTLLPASVKVASDEPAFALTLNRTVTGIELRWPTVNGMSYRLEEGDTLADWQTYATYVGTGEEIVIDLNPYIEHPLRRFYRVMKSE